MVIPSDVDLFLTDLWPHSQRCTKVNDSFPRQLTDIEIILRLAASLTCLMSASLKSLFFDEMDFTEFQEFLFTAKI